MHNAATLTLTAQFVDRAHTLDAAQWQRIAQGARRIHIGRILEAVLTEWSFDDRLRAVGPQRLLFARHLGRWATRLLPAAGPSHGTADRVFGPGAGDSETGPIDTAVLAALTAIDQRALLPDGTVQALYAPFAEAIPLDSLAPRADGPSGGLAAALETYSEERTPAFAPGQGRSRLQRRNLAVRHALAQTVVAESTPAGGRRPMPNFSALRPAWLSDLAAYRPPARTVAACVSLAAGLGLVGFAVLGFRGGDAGDAIAPVSGAVVSPAVLNPLTAPPVAAAPVTAPPVISTTVVIPADSVLADGTPTAGAPAAGIDTDGTDTDGAGPGLDGSPASDASAPAPLRAGGVPAPAAVPGAAPTLVPAEAPAEVLAVAPAAAPASPAPERIGRVPAPAAVCADGACWLAMGAVYEADGDWARAAAAYAAGAEFGSGPEVVIDEQTGQNLAAEAGARAGLLRALHPQDTADAVSSASAMTWLGNELVVARAGGSPHSLLLMQAALNALFTETIDQHATAAAYQVVNRAPVSFGFGQLEPVGAVTTGDRFLPVGRCNDPIGQWIAVWFTGGRDNHAMPGWLNLQLADPTMQPLLGSQEANNALLAQLPIANATACVF